jgi:pimeloyl-ACP methyl ester carboxylesterase
MESHIGQPWAHGDFLTLNRLWAGIAIAAIAAALWNLHGASAGILISSTALDGTPVTIYHPASPGITPVVVIAHGFAGSQQLMRSFALTFARNGYVAVTFDFPGHGRSPKPLTGSITDANGATRTLVAELSRVAAFARGLGDGRLAVLGHSMASDIVVRFSQETPDIAATIAVSMFSPAVTATSPRNLLVIDGDWEGTLKREALRAVGLATSPALPEAGVTYGDMSLGTARRAAISRHVEHVSVLYSQDSMREAVAWLDQSFGNKRRTEPLLDHSGPWIMLLIAGVVWLARPLSSLLPRVAVPPVGAGLEWRRLWMPLLVPMAATPLLLRVLPTHFLPVLVADYLAAHFAVYGLLTAICLQWPWPRPAVSASSATSTTTATATETTMTDTAEAAHFTTSRQQTSKRGLALAALAVIVYGFVALVWPINDFFTSFVLARSRVILLLAMLVGTLLYFLSDEWLTRGAHAARGAYIVSKVCFLLSLALAIALDPERLFFLIIIVPVVVLFFLAYGLFSGWIYRRTGHPFVAGIANAVAFAWAIAVTFPLLAG